MPAITVFNAHPRFRPRRAPVTEAVRAVLRGERRRRAVVSVILIDTPFCLRINRRFLHHWYSTDVITFPLEGPPNLEGEIYVNLDKARDQAARFRVPFYNELTRLVVHGTLHLLGYDDKRCTEASRMRVREDQYVHWLAGKV